MGGATAFQVHKLTWACVVFFYIKRGIFNSGNLICHLAIVIIFLYISKFYLNYRVRYVVGAVTYFRGVGGRERERVGPWQMVAA